MKSEKEMKLLPKDKKKTNQRIGILTFSCADDMGGMLQCYALKRTLGRLAQDPGAVRVLPYAPCYMVGRHWLLPYVRRGTTSLPTFLRNELRLFAGNVYAFRSFCRRRACMAAFRREYLTAERPVRDGRKLAKDCPGLLFLGSDQIWSPGITYTLDPTYFGAFCRPEIRVVAYAASLGGARLEEKYDARLKKLLKHVDVITLREKSSIPYVEELAGCRVRQMPDPVLLTTAADWMDMIGPKPAGQPYLLFCNTDRNDAALDAACAFAKARGLRVRSVNQRYLHRTDVSAVSCYGSGPKEFLNLICHADYVFTNSFHCLVFSLLFHKRFHCFARSARNNRLTDLLEGLGLTMERAVDEYDRTSMRNSEADPSECSADVCGENRETRPSGNGITLSGLDYEDIDRKLEAQRTEAMEFLREQLN